MCARVSVHLHAPVHAPPYLVHLAELLEESESLTPVAQAVLDGSVHPVPLAVGPAERRTGELGVALQQAKELVASRRQLQDVVDEIEEPAERAVVAGSEAKLERLAQVLGVAWEATPLPPEPGPHLGGQELPTRTRQR